MVHKVVRKVVFRYRGLRNKLDEKKDKFKQRKALKISEQWDKLYTSSSIEDKCDNDNTTWPPFTKNRPSPLGDIPIEILEIIITSIVRLPDFYSAASFAVTSRLHRKLVRRALVESYRQPLLSEIEFRDLLMVDCSVFGANCLKEYRRDWWYRWMNSEEPDTYKHIDVWQTQQETRLLEGRNGTLLVAGLKSYQVSTEQPPEGRC